MIDSKVLAFAGVALILTLTPGADTMLIIRKLLAYGRKDRFFTLAGIVSGLFVHATLSALWLSVILMRSVEALLLATIHLLEGVIWLSVVIVFIGIMRRLFSRPSVQRNLEAVAGVILIALGLRLAIEQR